MFDMGPVLSLKEVVADDSGWDLSVLVVCQEKPGPLRLSGAGNVTANAEELWRVGKQAAWRYLFAVNLSEHESAVTYAIGDQSFEVALPARGHPPRIAYASCNGFSSLKAMKGVDDKNALWKKMAAQHAAKPFNLLMLGGDQVYADSMWDVLPDMKRWAELDFKAGNKAKATASMKEKLTRFYFELYTSRWAQAEMDYVWSAAYLAVAVSFMMAVIVLISA